MKEEHSRFFVQWLVPAVCMVAIIIIMFFNFFTRTKMEAIESVEDEMTEVVDRYAAKINNELSKMQVVGEVAARSIYADGEIDSAVVRRVATSVITYTPAYEVIYYTGDGKGINHLGREIDVSKRVQFMKVSRASEVTYQYVQTDGEKEEILDSLQIVIPVSGNERHKLVIYYPMENIKSFIRMNGEFDAEAFFALVDIEGKILKSGDEESEFLKNGNVWENLPSEYRNSIVKVKVQIMNRSNGCLKAEIGEEGRSLVYSPIGINDWAVVAGVNQEYVEEKEMRMWKSTSRMLYQLIGVIFFFLAIFIIINVFTRRKTEERDRLLQEKADTDLLTGLSNKLATERKIKEYMQKYPDSLAMMFVLDIDNFKKINDTMGHAFGDEVLRCLGKQVSSVFRVTDIVGRSGGDEFTIFLKFLKDDSNTLKEAQKLVNFFKDFVAGEYVKYSATASIGAAVFPAHGADFETLYKSADKALYKAKLRGKNQLAFFDDRDRGGLEAAESKQNQSGQEEQN